MPTSTLLLHILSALKVPRGVDPGARGTGLPNVEWMGQQCHVYIPIVSACMHMHMHICICICAYGIIIVNAVTAFTPESLQSVGNTELKLLLWSEVPELKNKEYLHCALSCAVYCNRPCLSVCVR